MTCKIKIAVFKAKTVTCIGFDKQIKFYFSDYSTAPPWFEQRFTKLFKRTVTAK